MELSRKILLQNWGYDSFRPMQEDIVDAAINGQDVLALLPTGGGKSVCFQVPGIAREGICIVVSPLIALMNDQVEQLQRRGIKAKAITSGMRFQEIDAILDNARFGLLKFLYLSPERLKTSLFIERFKLMKVALIVIDEAHCISEWGHDFRPPYREIALLRNHHPNIPFMALTATATNRVKEDIVKQLKLNNVAQFEADFSRNNISYEIYKVENKLLEISKLVENNQDKTGIIYCQTRKSVKFLSQYFVQKNIPVGFYHGGLSKEQREDMMKAWLSNKVRFMIATNAFGMGIDKPDVRLVLHYEFPLNPEAYFQEAGRAGRDGKDSRTMVFYEEKDISRAEEQINNQFPEKEFVKSVYLALCNWLKIAIGSGDNSTYPFDIIDFCKQFSFNINTCYQALKLLELNETLQFNEDFFQRTKIKFNVDNFALYNFQLKNEQYTPLITLLSRSYPGIFDHFQTIHEEELNKRMLNQKISLQIALENLEKMGLIDVLWKSQLPQITFIHERLPDQYFSLKTEVFENRKKVLQERWVAMKQVLTARDCRAKILINYFGQQAENCGKCDFCNINESNFNAKELLKIISISSGIDFSQLIRHFPLVNEREIKSQVKALLLEELIHFDGGKYFINP